MLRIVDYAKGKDIEWYEVIRLAINYTILKKQSNTSC